MNKADKEQLRYLAGQLYEETREMIYEFTGFSKTEANRVAAKVEQAFIEAMIERAAETKRGIL